MTRLAVRGVKSRRPRIIGMGCGVTSGSTTEKAVQIALSAAEAAGAEVTFLGVESIMTLPIYLSEGSTDSVAAKKLIDTISFADGLILGSPGYHGTISGAMKNSIDYFQETFENDRPYLTNMPVGLIGVAGGHQAAMSTLITLRSIVHSLRGWPTPYGVALNSQETTLGKVGSKADQHLKRVGQQVMDFFALSGKSAA